jgi:hypothetical protein
MQTVYAFRSKNILKVLKFEAKIAKKMRNKAKTCEK